MTPDTLRPITDDELRIYRQDGVVWLKGIIDLAWVEELRTAITELMADPPPSAVSLTNLGLLADAPEQVRGFVAGEMWGRAKEQWGNADYMRGTVLLDRTVPEAPPDGRGHFWSITGSWRKNHRIRALAMESPFPAIAARLMESERVHLCGDADQILVKPPLTRERTAWHQDMVYDHVSGWHRIAIRMPCDPEDRDVGTVGYLRGSHRSGTEYKVNYFISDMASPDDPGADLPKIDGDEGAFDLVYFSPKPGDLVVHHIGTVHGAGGNRSADRTRRAITIRYCGDDAVYKARPLAPPVGSPPKIADGESVVGDATLFPPVWPR